VGFPEPLFLSRGVTLKRLMLLSGQRHVRFTVEQRGSRIDGVWFKADPAFFELPPGSKLDIVYHLQLDEWKGFLKPELRLRDFRLADAR
jgi:single-stranded-DNA-specific exonuclease